MLETQTLFITGMITGTILFSYAANLMTAIQALPSQLSSYNIDECECYCCSNDHKDPSGGTIPCDRELVFHTIQEWYQNSDVQWKEQFNKQVRGYLTKVVQSTLSSSFAEVELATRLNAPWMILLAPVLLAPLVDQSTLDPTSLSTSELVAWRVHTVLDWVKMVLVFLLQTGLAFRTMNMLPYLLQRMNRLLAAMLCTLLTLVLTGLAWLPYEMHLMRATNLSLAPLVTFSFLVLANAAVFFPKGKCGRAAAG